MNWFEIDKNGLKTLQSRKPKTFIIRELIQNAWDEDVTKCHIDTEYHRGTATLSVDDNSPIGFRDLKDAYTFFSPCYKRPDPTKRGRFNAGEKQAFSVCTSATIITTKGTIVFDKDGRHRKKVSKEVGTLVIVKVRMTKKEYEEIIQYTRLLIPPLGTQVFLNGKELPKKKPIREASAKLQTEYLKGEKFIKTARNTCIELYEPEDGAYLYEMGIPVCPIECEFSIDVNQRVPMGIDRDTVSQSYLQDLYAEVLNATHDIIPVENISDTWVRTGMSDTKRIEGKAVKTVLNKRFGDKHLSRSIKDAVSNDDAISHGYKVISGSEMSKDEWNSAKKYDLISSTTDKFGKGTTSSEPVNPDINMQKVEYIAKKIAKQTLGIEITVSFIKCKDNNTPGATYSNRHLTFYVSKLGKGFFEHPISPRVLSLVIHEIGHEKGHHTEASYHKALTGIGAELIDMALNDPEFFMEVV